MAKAREGEFPVEGDRALADDGSVWTYQQVTQPEGGTILAWVQGEPWMSATEIEAAETAEQDGVNRLSIDHRVYALAFGGVKTAKRENELSESDPKEQFVLALATAALRDSVIQVATGSRSNLEIGTLTRMRTFLGDPEVATAQAELARLRAQVADDVAPESVTAKARAPLQALSEIAGKLPVESDARKTITKIVSGQKAQPELTDKLFREVYMQTQDPNLAIAALEAAGGIAQAFA